MRFDLKTEAAQKIVPAAIEKRDRSRPGGAPIGAFTRADAQFMRGEKTLVAHATELRINGREAITQCAQRGMAVWRIERFAADAFDLSGIDIDARRWIVAGGATE